MGTIVALIPAHDEAERIARTVRAAASVEGVSQVLVIDDASADDTAALARDAGATVIRLERNAGKGGALNAGAYRLGDDVDIVLLLDADLGDSAAQGAALLGPVIAGEADMTVAMLPKPPGSGGFGLVKALARWGIRRLGGGFEANAPISGQRALNKRALTAVRPFERGYGAEVAMTIKALGAGLRVVEVATTMTHAATGRDIAGFTHRARQFAHVARALARARGRA